MKKVLFNPTQVKEQGWKVGDEVITTDVVCWGDISWWMEEDPEWENTKKYFTNIDEENQTADIKKGVKMKLTTLRGSQGGWPEFQIGNSDGFAWTEPVWVLVKAQKIYDSKHLDEIEAAFIYNNVDFLYQVLIDDGYFTNDELQLITDINGYNIETLNDCIYARYGYLDFMELYDIDLNLDPETITYKIKAFNIVYDIKDEDIDDDLSIEYVKDGLPTEVIVKVEDLDDETIAEAISEETGWLVESFEYEVL